MRYARAVRSWLSAFELPGINILVAITEADTLLFLALQKVREDAKKDPLFKPLKGRKLVNALDEQQALWGRVINASNELDREAHLPLRTVFSLVTLDLACPRADGALAA